MGDEPPSFLASQFALLATLDDKATQHHFGGRTAVPGEVMHMLMTGAVANVANGSIVAAACDAAALDVAAGSGYKAAVTTTTSVVTEAIAREQDFTKLAHISYDDFELGGQKPFLGV